MTTTSQNCANYSEMKVSFTYITVSFDNANEDFWLQISTNGGSTYTTVADYNYSVQFTNGVRQNATVTIPGPFSSTTRFRFRCDASADDDQVYIDDVVITGCQPSLFADGGIDESDTAVAFEKTEEASSDIFDIKTGPNPASDFYLVYFMAQAGVRLDYAVTDMTSRIVLQNRYICIEGRNQLSIGLQDLAKGAYIVSLRTAVGQHVQKLIVSK